MYKTHGLSKTRQYTQWAAMKQRCYNKKDKWYPHYGGRGIRVCPNWKKSFEAFLRDMGKCPAGLQLDRINNNKGYNKHNCRWATPRQQSNNSRTAVKLRFSGECRSLTGWSRHLGIPYTTIASRYFKQWPVDKILKRGRAKHPEGYNAKHMVQYKGKLLTLRQYATRTGMNIHTVRGSFARGKIQQEMEIM